MCIIFWSIIISLLSGTVAALITSYFSYRQNKELIKQDKLNKKISAFMYLENMLNQLVNYEAIPDYSDTCYIIYRYSDSLEAFQSLLKRVFIYNYSFDEKIILKLRELESIIDKSINENNYNQGNDKNSLIEEGKKQYSNIKEIIKDLRNYINEFYNQWQNTTI